VTDRIALTLGGDEDLLEAAREHEAYVAGETLATSVGYSDADGQRLTVDGRELAISVERAQPDPGASAS
jgi:isoleucyl-tRNA synthetase